jgi:hypothetical protein
VHFSVFGLLRTETGVVSGLITQSNINESGKVERSKLGKMSWKL